MEVNVKAIRTGEKIIVFANGKRHTISEKISPEIFKLTLSYIQEGKNFEIAKLFNDFDKDLRDYLQEVFNVENNLVYYKETKKPLAYSKLILRKALEMMAMDSSPIPLVKLAKKIEHRDNVKENGVEMFALIKELSLTENGNLVFHVNISEEDKKTKSVIGKPYDFNKRNSGAYFINLSDSEEEANSTILVSPFDILSFNEKGVNVTRYKILNEIQYTKDSIISVKNEFLFDLPFELFEKNYVKKEDDKGNL